MRRIILAVVSVLGCAPASSALAGGCYFFNGRAFCDPGCEITNQWWDGNGQEWIRYSCTPSPPDLMVLIVVGAVAVVIALLINSSTSSPPFEDDTAALDAEIAKTKELADKLEAASREADAHLAAFRADGGHYDGDPGHG